MECLKFLAWGGIAALESKEMSLQWAAAADGGERIGSGSKVENGIGALKGRGRALTCELTSIKAKDILE